MENMSRVKKYKDLRDSITNGEVDLEDYKKEAEEVKDVEEEEDDWFKFPTLEFDDDFSITSADLTEEKQEEALSRVREKTDDGVTLNTRLDILNQIMSLNQGVKHEGNQKVVSEKVVKKEKDEDFQQSISDIIKSEKVEDVKVVIKEEVEEEMEEVKVEKQETPRKFFKFSDDDEDEIDDDDEDEVSDDEEEYDESKTSFIEKLLTFVMVVLVLLLIALLAFFIKLSLFSS